MFEAVGKRLGQPVVIENKPGANSTIGVSQTARSPADGYHFVSVLAAYTVNMSLYKKLPYKASDFVAVSHVADLPMFLFTSNKLPVSNARELAEYGKQNPLNYASSGTGASAHMIGARWAQENGLNAQHVPYNGSAPILSDLMSGQVDMLFDPALVPMPHAKTGKIKVLAVASKQRWPGEPDIPTMEESGFPGFVMNSWVGVLAPKARLSLSWTSSHKPLQRPSLPRSQEQADTAGLCSRGQQPCRIPAADRSGHSHVPRCD